MSKLPFGWKEVRFGEIFDFKGGSQPPKSNFINSPRPGYIRLLQIRDFESDAKAVYIPNTPKWPKCTEADIMIGRYGASVGKVLGGKSGAYNVALVRIIVDGKKIDRAWARYFFKSDYFQNPIATISRSAQNGFNKDDLYPIKILLPSLDEQRRIVLKLDKLLAHSKQAAEKLVRVSGLAKRYKQAALDAAFQGDLTAAWRLARFGSSGLDHWSHRALREIANVASGQTPKGIETHLSDTGEVMWFKVSSMNGVGNGEYLTRSEFRLSSSTADRLGIRLFPAETIVFPKRGGAIATNKKRKLGVTAALDLNLMAVAARNVSPEYLWFWFQGLDLSTISNGSNVPQINHGDVEPLVVPVPPNEEQTEIVRRLREAINRTSVVEIEVQSCMKLVESFDQAALAKAFRGELIPNSFAEEPKSEPVGQAMAEATEISVPTRIPA